MAEDSNYYLADYTKVEQSLVGYPDGYYNAVVRWNRAGKGGSFTLNEKHHTYQAAIEYAHQYIKETYGGEIVSDSSKFPQVINLGDRKYTPNALTWLQKSFEQTPQILEDDECICLHYNRLDCTYDSVFTNRKVSVYQHEQISAANNLWFNPKSKSKIVQRRTKHIKDWLDKSYKIYEYDVDNYNMLLDLGYGHKTVLLPVTALNPYLYEQPKSIKKDIDILFYGSLNSRRAKILSKLAQTYNVVVLSHTSEHHYLKDSNAQVYPPAFFDNLWHYLSRAKVVLNLHYYSIQEQVRISEAVANGCYVLSERSRRNQYLDLIEEFDTYEELIEKLSVVKTDLSEKYLTINDW